MVSDDCVSAGLVDEWLQVRNALSIEIFLRDTQWGSSPRLLRPKASPTASSGGNEHSAASVRHPAFVDAGDDRHPSIGAEDMHSGRTRLVSPLIDRLRQPGPPALPRERGGSLQKIRYSARAPPAATRRRDRCERAGDLLQLNLR